MKSRPRMISRSASIGTSHSSRVVVVIATNIAKNDAKAVLDALRASPLDDALKHCKRARRASDETCEIVLGRSRRRRGGENAEDRRGWMSANEAKAEVEVDEELGERAKRARAASVSREVGYAYVEIDSRAPTTKEEWIERCKTWPVSLNVARGEEREEELEERRVDEESEYLATWTRAAVRAADGATSRSGARGIGNCAIIVDPKTGREIARAVDESRVHPLRHAAMAAVDYAARRDLETYPELDFIQERIEARRAEKLAEDIAIGNDDVDDDDGERDCASDGKKRKRDAATSGEAVTELMGRPYLCTGYDVFLAREPCLMCAMALVHSRLKRVIFAATNAETGALSGAEAGVRRLHGVRSLNHHYSVFTYDADEDELRAIADSGAD